MEVTDDELKEYAADVLLKVLGAAWRSMEGALTDPQAAAFAMNLFQQGMQAGSRVVMQQQQQRKRGPVPTHPPGYGPGFGPGMAPIGFGYPPPGPYGPGAPPGPYGPGAPPGPYGPGAVPYGTPGANGPASPGNVQGIRSGGTNGIERCFPIEGTRQTEEGVGCCQCATFNGLQRTVCRYCGHTLCHEREQPPIVTPPPIRTPGPGMGGSPPPNEGA